MSAEPSRAEPDPSAEPTQPEPEPEPEPASGSASHPAPHQSAAPYPWPSPRLSFLARFRVDLEAMLDLGATPWGERRIIPIVGGSFEGPRLRGDILPGGGDWQIVHPDGVAEIDTRYTLRTDDEALIHLTTTGLRYGPPEVVARLRRGEDVDPRSYYFRLVCRFETGDVRYAGLNRTIAVAAAMRSANTVRYEAHALV
ncbi:DUF3237 domain-containing protein [Embleya hyalina]|uniref:UPF0311 protein EHYA_03247 n=1 Tax=Embleya hyalina TaxID=516124 RepID=A0A401YLT4_9ACTN|nr:DUF3237 domain-containing protein [Embleya hyalina]GCD95572.1 UPF0311 protein [Embleya hyalina]